MFECLSPFCNILFQVKQKTPKTSKKPQNLKKTASQTKLPKNQHRHYPMPHILWIYTLMLRNTLILNL